MPQPFATAFGVGIAAKEAASSVGENKAAKNEKTALGVGEDRRDRRCRNISSETAYSVGLESSEHVETA